MTVRLEISDLAPNTTEKDLDKLVDEYGAVYSRVVPDGRGFITFTISSAAQAALTLLSLKKVKVRFATEDRSPEQVEAEHLRALYHGELVKLKSDNFKEIIIVSLKARMQIIPLKFHDSLQKQFEICNQVIGFLGARVKEVDDLFDLFIGNLCMAQTRVFEGFVLRLENQIDKEKYTEEKLLEIIRRKIGYVDTFFNTERSTLNLEVASGDTLMKLDIDKADFLKKAPSWLEKVGVPGSPEQIKRYGESSTEIIYHSNSKLVGFTSINGLLSFLSTARRDKTPKHERSHGLLRFLELDPEHDATPWKRLEAALLISPVKIKGLVINGEMTESGNHFENTYLETNRQKGDWPIFCSFEDEEETEE